MGKNPSGKRVVKILDHAKFLQVILSRFGRTRMTRSLPSDVLLQAHTNLWSRVRDALPVVIDVF